MKQVCILGLGQFGSHLARTLARMNCEVLAIDRDEQAVNALRDEVHRVVITDLRSLDALKSIVTSQIDEAVVSLGESLEASILCTLHLAKIGVKKIRAKASSGDHAAILKAVGATDVIFPERETAERMAQRIMNPDLLDYLPLTSEYRVVEIPVPEALAGQSLAELHLRKKFNVLVIAIKPAEGKIDFMPSAEAKINKGNTLVLLGTEASIQKFQEAD